MFALLEVSDLGYDRRSESVPQALAVSMIAFDRPPNAGFSGGGADDALDETALRSVHATDHRTPAGPSRCNPLLGTIRYR
jgi:hypothetical protein